MPHLQEANDKLWTATRAALGFGPARLTRDRDPWEIWRSPDLLLAQTCGLPFRAKLAEEVQLVGTPDYGVEGCAAGFYRSVLVSKHALLSDCCSFAYNEPMSQSGWAAAQPYVSELDLLSPTGSHYASAQAVASGCADLACIDAVTWRHIHADFSTLRIIGETDPTPGLPFITSKGQYADQLARALMHAIVTEAEAASVLGLRGLVRIPASDYLALPLP